MQQIDPWPPWYVQRNLFESQLFSRMAKALEPIASSDPAILRKRIELLQAAADRLAISDGELKVRAVVAHAWALGDAPGPEREDNRDSAISLLEATLEKLGDHRPESQFLMGNLAELYLIKRTGSLEEWRTKAFAIYDRMQNAIESESSPLAAARLEARIGRHLVSCETGDPVKNACLGIEKLENAKAVLVEEQLLKEVADVDVDIAVARSVLPAKLQNERHDPIEIIDGAIEKYLVEDQHFEAAKAKAIKAHLIVELNVGGEENAKATAISILQETLKVFSPEQHPDEHRQTLAAIASVASARRGGLSKEQEQLSTAAARSMVESLAPDETPVERARAMVALGNSLMKTRPENKKKDLEEAISTFEAARDLISSSACKDCWQEATHSLANAYAERQMGSVYWNMQKSVELLFELLGQIDEIAQPLQWASIAHHLALSCSGMRAHLNADNVERAISFLERAAMIAKDESFPIQRAGILESLATAFEDRMRGDEDDNLDDALFAISSAENLIDRNSDIENWLRIRTKASSIRLKVHNRKDDSSPIDEGDPKSVDRVRTDEYLKMLEKDCELLSPDEQPRTWIAAQVRLAAMVSRSVSDDVEGLENVISTSVENNKRAISIYESAIEVSDKYCGENYSEWLHMHAGSCYVIQAVLIDGRSHFCEYADEQGEAVRARKAAIEHFRTGFVLNDVNENPLKYLECASTLGDTLGDNGDWEEAGKVLLEATVAADKLVERLELTPAEQSKVLNHLAKITILSGFAAAKCGNFDMAIECVETGRARMLRKMMLLDQSVVDSSTINRIFGLMGNVRVAERKLTSPTLIDRGSAVDELTNRREQLEAELQTLPAIQLGKQATASNLPSVDGLIVVPLLPKLKKEGAILVAGNSLNKTSCVHLDYSLVSKLKHKDSSSIGDETWARAYQRHLFGLGDWEGFLEKVSKDLGEFLVLQIEPLISCEDHQQLYFLPQDTLGRLPLATAKTSDGSHLLDKFSISVAPSIHTIEVSKKRLSSLSTPKSILIIADLDHQQEGKDLEYASFEVEMIASLFPTDSVTILTGKEATVSSTLDLLSTADACHFISHGVFVENSLDSSGITLPSGELLSIEQLLTNGKRGTPNFVSLAVCESASYSSAELPSELFGLPTAFLQSGAASVVGTLWEVTDGPSSLLMFLFYENLVVRKFRASQALRRAQLSLRDMTIHELRRLLEVWHDEGRVSKPSCAQWIKDMGDADFKEKPFSYLEDWGAFVHYGA